jgi:hypothetical protein
VVADRTDHHKMFGLSNGDGSPDYSEIDYALEMAGNSTLKIHESGNAVAGNFGPYAVGDGADRSRWSESCTYNSLP